MQYFRSGGSPLLCSIKLGLKRYSILGSSLRTAAWPVASFLAIQNSVLELSTPILAISLSLLGDTTGQKPSLLNKAALQIPFSLRVAVLLLIPTVLAVLPACLIDEISSSRQPYFLKCFCDILCYLS